MLKREIHSAALFQSELYKTVSTVVQTEDMVLVADPSWLPGEVEQIRRHVDRVIGDRLLFLLFTHSDYDHIIGGGAFPDARVIASKALAESGPEERESVLEQIRAFDDEYYLDRNYEVVFPVVDHAISEEGETIAVGGTRLTFYAAPGHTRDGLFTVVEPAGLLIAGDYLSDVEFPYIYCDSRLYEHSLTKLDSILDRHRIRMLIPGHGSETEGSAEMIRRRDDDLAYIHAMRRAVQSRDQAAIDGLIVGCRYPRNMRKFHRDNQLLFERELAGKQ